MEEFRKWMLLVGPIAGVATGVAAFLSGMSPAASWTLGVTVLVASWWITEPIPIPATSLIPIAMFPLIGVLEPVQVAASVGHKLVLLMMGGFMLSAAMERSGAHRRIALGMVNLIGADSGQRLVFGFMAASAFLSMWISNAATALMLLPIAMAVVGQTKNRALQSSLLIGIAYAASIGGVGTPIGTPPNLVFMDVYERTTGQSIGFLDWMTIGLPAVVILLPIAGIWLTRGIKLEHPIELPDVGRWRSEEVRTLIVFAITALLWITRTQPFGGWSELLNQLGFPVPYANDASIALAGAVALFVIPNGKGERLMDWDSAKTIPWGILILFGGGICIATAFKTSGLSEQLGSAIAGISQLHVLLLIATICFAVTFLTEVTSNTATTQLLLPILATAAVAATVDPKLFLVPATISASCAFMLPVATPPNAIVFGSGKFTVGEMVKHGIVLNLIGVVVISLVCYVMFGSTTK